MLHDYWYEKLFSSKHFLYSLFLFPVASSASHRSYCAQKIHLSLHIGLLPSFISCEYGWKLLYRKSFLFCSDLSQFVSFAKSYISGMNVTKDCYKIVKARILLTSRSFVWNCLVVIVFGLVLQIEIISQTLKRSLQKKLWEKLTSKIQNLKFTISFKTSTWLQESRNVEDIRLEYDLWQKYVVYAGVNNALLQTSFF